MKYNAQIKLFELNILNHTFAEHQKQQDIIQRNKLLLHFCYIIIYSAPYFYASPM